jgi:hypothetical protein
MTPHPPEVMAENARLRRALASLRMRYANLLAAARATLTATHDGEAHPLAYLIDELAAQGQLPPAETAALIPHGTTPWADPVSESADGWDQR